MSTNNGPTPDSVRMVKTELPEVFVDGKKIEVENVVYHGKFDIITGTLYLDPIKQRLPDDLYDSLPEGVPFEIRLKKGE